MAGMPRTATRNKMVALAQKSAQIIDQVSPQNGIWGLGEGASLRSMGF